MKVAGVFHVERRASVRHDATLRVTFPWEGHNVEGTTLDVSEGGLRLLSDAELKVGLRLVLYLEVRLGEALQRLEVEVARVKKAPKGYECGCRFVVLPDGALARLRSVFTEPTETEQVDEADIIELPPQEQSFDPKELDAALASDTERRGKNKQVAEQLLKIARGLIEQGELDTATTVLEQGAQRVPDSADIIEELAQLQFKRGRVSEAAALFDKALRIRQEQGSG